MPLPSSRNTTYSASSPVKSADLNALQDCIVGNKHGSMPVHIGAPSWKIIGAGVANDPNGTEITLGTHTGGADTPSAICSVDIPAGCTVTQILVRARKTSASGTVTARYKHFETDGGGGLTTASASNSANNPGYISLTMSGLAEVIAAGEAFTVQIEGGGVTGDRLLSCEVSYIRT
jgi:hypothetical protein